MSTSGTLPGYQASAEFDNPRCGLLRSIHESHDIPKRPHAQPIARHLHREILLRPVELSPIDRRRIHIHLKLPQQQRRGVRTTSTRLDSGPFARLIVPILTCSRALRWTASSDRVTLLGDRMPPQFPDCRRRCLRRDHPHVLRYSQCHRAHLGLAVRGPG